MNFHRLTYLVLSIGAFVSFSKVVPAQPQLGALPVDSRIEKGTLGSGVTYYMVTNPSVKGYAEFALVQRGEPLSEAKREGLQSAFFARMGIAPGREGYLSDHNGSTVYRFGRVPVYRKEVLDSTLLYTFRQVALCRAEQAVIVAGDIDAPELKKKMDIFSMLVPRMLVKENHRPDYVWETSPAPVVQFTPGEQSWVSVSYEGARVPFPLMNTAQALVTDLFGQELSLLVRHRLRRNLSDARIPFGDIRFETRGSADDGGNERYSVSVMVPPAQMDAAMRVISGTLGELDSFGAGTEEFREAKQVLLPQIRRRASEVPTPEEDARRCVAHFLYGANLAPYSETLRLFARKNVADSTETRLFNAFSGALLEQLANLTLEYRSAPDSLEGDDALFYYNLEYLYGSLARSGRDYTWKGADTLGMEVNCPRVRIRSEKREAVSGGVLWTFSNGMRVIFKHVPGSGMFHYALQLNGGLSQIDGLRPGEGGYIGEMLALSDIGPLRASQFRDVLEAGGVAMNARVDLNSMAITGSAPSQQITFLLKSLLALTNRRKPRPSEFEAYRLQQELLGVSLEDRMMRVLEQGYDYTLGRDPSALREDTPKKAEKYFSDRFSRVNDGVLILAGDLDEVQLRRTLGHYLGGFRVMKGTTPRKAVRFKAANVVHTETLDGGEPGIHLLLDNACAVTADNHYTAQVAVQYLEKALIRHLAPYGFSPRLSFSLRVHPEERFRIHIHCAPLSLSSVPADVSEISPERALSAARAAIREVSQQAPDPKDLALWKSKAEGELLTALSRPESFVSVLLARYSMNKDLLTTARQSIAGVNAAKVCSFLGTLADGGRVETLVK